MEGNKTLKASALVCCQSYSIEKKVDNFVSKLNVTLGENISCVFLTTDKIFRVEKLLISSFTDFIYAGRL
jgi:hypothetical protein